MSGISDGPTQLNGYHAHIYYDTARRPVAERLASAIGSKFPVQFGGFHDTPIGPHPIANLQVIFATAEFHHVVPWLMLNRDGLDVLIHPLSDDSVDDHSRYALWLGTPVPLKLETLRRRYRPELLPAGQDLPSQDFVRERSMIKLDRIGHVNLRVADQEASKRFYRDILGFAIAEEDPEHGGVFMTLGENFHTLDIGQHPTPDAAPRPQRGQIGLAHIAFQVGSYAALRDAYRHLVASGVEILRATNHVNQRSFYFADPDGNTLEIYYEMPHALQLFEGGRSDDDAALPVSGRNEPLPAWLLEDWPGPEMQARIDQLQAQGRQGAQV
ncbi:MAG TPA: DOPA 4,5-dioxygenase family protein [Stellaceae bacterium]|nr:DOPA 4,5-dioxygenase family protein [Stellaceae bacterium]